MAALAGEKILEFFEESPSRRTVIGRYQAVLERLLEYLRGIGQVPPPKPRSDDSAMGGLLRDFAQYLGKERGLAHSTLASHQRWAQRFLVERFGAAHPRLGDLCLTAVRRQHHGTSS